jgi:hypothetical protein
MKNNYEAFIELIKRYENITLEEIEKVGRYNRERLFWGGRVASRLTGFGNKLSCSLCEAVDITRCEECLWMISTQSVCVKGGNKETYDNIDFALNPKQLIEAFRERAKRMKEVLKSYQEDITNEEKG